MTVTESKYRPHTVCRDAQHWQSIQDKVQNELEQQPKRRGGAGGERSMPGRVGLVIDPQLMMLTILTIVPSACSSFNREHHRRSTSQLNRLSLCHPNQRDGDGPTALVLFISVQVRHDDRIVSPAHYRRASIPEPSYAMVQTVVIHVMTPYKRI